MVDKAQDKLGLDAYVVELGSIEDRIKKLREKRNYANRKMKESMQLRNEHNLQVAKYLNAAKEYEEKRNKLNEEVKSLKIKRKELQKILLEKKKELYQLMDEDTSANRYQLHKLKKKIEDINKKIQKIEWDIQTKSNLDAEEEKMLIQRAEKLSGQLNKLMVSIQLSKKQSELWKEISKVQKEVNQIHNAIVEMAKESQVFHKLMNQNYAKVNESRKLANKYHKSFLSYKKEGDEIHKELLSIYSDRNKIKEKLSKLKKSFRERHKQALRQNLEKNVQEAFAKYEKGSNLTLDEFRLLVDRGLI